MCHPARSKIRTGVRALCDVSGDLVDMELHHDGVGEGKRERRALAARWADGAEEIGVLVTLIGRLPRPRSPPRPLPHDAVLLADPRLVLEPDLDGRRLGQIGKVDTQDRGEVFLYSSMIRASWPGWRGRALMCEKPIFFSNLPT